MNDLAREWEAIMEKAKKDPEVVEILQIVEDTQPYLDTCRMVEAVLNPDPVTVTTNNTGEENPIGGLS